MAAGAAGADVVVLSSPRGLTFSSVSSFIPDFWEGEENPKLSLLDLAPPSDGDWHALNASCLSILRS